MLTTSEKRRSNGRWNMPQELPAPPASSLTSLRQDGKYSGQGFSKIRPFFCNIVDGEQALADIKQQEAGPRAPASCCS
jgi:hypothetical protein